MQKLQQQRPVQQELFVLQCQQQGKTPFDQPPRLQNSCISMLQGTNSGALDEHPAAINPGAACFMPMAPASSAAGIGLPREHTSDFCEAITSQMALLCLQRRLKARTTTR
jgi:hypothetical protein